MTVKNNSDEDDVGKVAITMCADHQGRGQHDAYVSQGAAPYGATYIKDGDDYDHIHDDDFCFLFINQIKSSPYGATYIKDGDNDDDVGADDDEDEGGIVI